MLAVLWYLTYQRWGLYRHLLAWRACRYLSVQMSGVCGQDIFQQRGENDLLGKTSVLKRIRGTLVQRDKISVIWDVGEIKISFKRTCKETENSCCNLLTMTPMKQQRNSLELMFMFVWLYLSSWESRWLMNVSPWRCCGRKRCCRWQRRVSYSPEDDSAETRQHITQLHRRTTLCYLKSLFHEDRALRRICEGRDGAQSIPSCGLPPGTCRNRWATPRTAPPWHPRSNWSTSSAQFSGLPHRTSCTQGDAEVGVSKQKIK